MVCEECGTREANCRVTVLAGGSRVTKYLCPECLARLRGNGGYGLADGFADMLAWVLSAITTSGTSGEEKDEKAEAPDKTCPRCGMSLRTFRKSGRLGCPECYKAFHDELQPVLAHIHGRVQHAGRRPLEGEEEQKTRSLQEELSREMEEAVRAEDFERAAQIRDRLRALAGEAKV